MRTGWPRRLLQGLGWVAGVGAAIALALAVGGVMPSRPLVAVVVALVILAFGLTLVDAAVIPLLAVLPLFVSFRAVFGGVDVSWSDIALATAFVPAVLFGRRPYSAPLRKLLWLTAVYQVATLFTVVANPYSQNTIEWFHAWLLTGGALVVGWTIGREGHARAGLSLVLIASVFLAVICIVQGMSGYLRGDFSAVFPAWPFPMHKNFAGCVLGVAAALAYARPAWMGWPKPWSLAAFWICVGGILATQSRQSLVALALVLIVLVLKRDPHRRRSKVILVTVVPALALVGTLVRDQLGVREPVQLRESEVGLVLGLGGGLESAALGWSRLAMVVHRPILVGLPASQRRDRGPQQHRSHRPGRLPGPDAGRTGRALEDGSGLRHRSVRRTGQPIRAGPAGPVLGGGADLHPVRHRRHLPRRRSAPRQRTRPHLGRLVHPPAAAVR